MIQMGNTARLVVLIILFFLCYQWPRRSWTCGSTRWIWDRTAESQWRPGRFSWWCPGWWRYNKETDRDKFEVFLSSLSQIRISISLLWVIRSCPSCRYLLRCALSAYWSPTCPRWIQSACWTSWRSTSPRAKTEAEKWIHVKLCPTLGQWSSPLWRITVSKLCSLYLIQTLWWNIITLNVTH